jgi:tryptophanyl-tRNA synthetase
MKKRIFSGIQPTGALHLGNYLGAIKNWVELQNKYDSIFCVVDLHALTVPQEPKELKKNILDTAAVFLAAGIDPKKSVIFVQSHLPEHAELAWLLNTITKIPELERMTQFKEKSTERRQSVNMGLFGYPVLMAADILLYQTDAVPVGEDQVQHVELARTLAQRFNRLYGKTFVAPQALLGKQGARIMGLDNPLKKMSKSANNPYNYISLTDSAKTIEDKIKKAVTDSGSEIKYEKNRPAIANLMVIYSLFSGLSYPTIEKKYQGKGYAQFKEDLAKTIIKGLSLFQKKFKSLQNKPAYLKKVLSQGAKEAKAIAQKKIKEVKEKMGLI